MSFDYQQFYCEENAYRLLAKLKVMQDLHEKTGRDTMKGWTVVDSYALFISSFHCDVAKQPIRSWPESMLPIAIQELAVDSSVRSAMVWDYHVIVLMHLKPIAGGVAEEDGAKEGWWVYDHDTKMSAPLGAPFGKHCIPMQKYFTASFFEWKNRHVPEPHTLEEFAKHTDEKLRCRLVKANDFLSGFSSDRSHMMNLMQPTGRDGKTNWMSPPPQWPAIQKQAGVDMNLAWYINMDNTQEAHTDEKAKAIAPRGTVMKLDEVVPLLMENKA